MTAAKKLDPTIYPDTDDTGEGELQQLINELFRPLLARFLATRGVAAHLGSNTFVYYKQLALRSGSRRTSTCCPASPSSA